MRIGIDLGGTKISALALHDDGATLFETRIKTPRDDYQGTITAICDLVNQCETTTDLHGSVGIGMPGSISPRTGLAQNANSTWLNNKPFQDDLCQALDREIRFANDANCFALSEATDGAAQNHNTVFGVILGTGCGGALVIDKVLLNGPRNSAGEWGHVPLPWMNAKEYPGPACWCGKKGCMETFVSGPAISKDHQRHNGEELTAQKIYQQANLNKHSAQATLARHTSRLTKGLAMIINIFDPDIIVLGGGLSQMHHLYKELPKAVAPFLFGDEKIVRISAPRHGDASGVRGAAWLWNND